MIYRFGDCELDDERYELRRAGKVVTIEPKVFNVLTYLIRHHDRVVTKEELLERFWPGTFISESALTRCLTMVRKAVQDNAAGQRMVKTARGYGYRFVAAIATGTRELPAVQALQAAPEQGISLQDAAMVSAPASGPASSPSTSDPANQSERSVVQAERKHVTVLWAALQGVTALSQAVASEVLHDLLERVFHLFYTEVSRVEGCIVQHTADSMTALFGAPIAYEDHAVRALHAAREIQYGLNVYARELQRMHGVNLTLRLGLHTGPVVVGSLGNDAWGRVAQSFTARLAYHLQEHAQAGSIYVSDAVRQQTEGFFQFNDLGVRRLPEVAQPLRIYVCIDVAKGSSRLQASLRRRVSVFLGRERDIEFLKALWTKANHGQGQVVCLFGEAGIGKSRLAYEFRQTVRAASVLEAQTLSYGQSMPYHAIIPLLRSVLEISDNDLLPRQRQHVRARLAAIQPLLADDEPLLAHLLGISVVPPQLPPLPPEEQKQRLQHICLQVIVRHTSTKPLCLLIEDLHWLDRSSQELLDRLVAALARLPILLLGTARPGFHHAWSDYTYFHRLNLEPLAEAHTDTLVRNHFWPHDASNALKALIREHTEGNPFFVEEMLHSLQEDELVALQGNKYILKASKKPEVPSSVRDVLAARIDRLASDPKEMLQIGAVIGRAFPLWLLEVITHRTHLQTNLAPLCQLELIYHQAALPEPTYVFKHALTQEVAYESVLPQTRKMLHGRIAQALEGRYAARLEEVVPLLAHHFSLAGFWLQAVQYGWQAAQKAYRLGQLHEAVMLLELAQAWLLQLPESQSRQETLIDLQLDTGWSLLYLGQSDRLSRMCRDAEPVACALGDHVRRAKVCFLHGLSYCFRSEYKHAELYFLYALKHLEEAGEDTLITSTTLALLYNAQGQWNKAAPLLTASIQTYEARQIQTTYPDWGLDYLPYAMCCVVLAHILALQGRVKEAKAVVHKVSTPALHHAANLVTKAHCAGWYSLFAAVLGEDLGALAYADDILTRTTEIEAPIFRFGGYTAKGTALLAVEDFAGVRKACEQALQAVAGTSHRDGLALVYANLTRANLALGDWAAAKCAYQAGLPLVQLTPERDTPRFDCLNAQLLASGNAPDFAQAEAFFAKSMQADEAAGATLLAAQTCFFLAQMLLCKGDDARARALFTTLHEQFRRWHVPVWQRKCKQALTSLVAASQKHMGG